MSALLKDFIQEARLRLGRIYPAQEAGAMVAALCEEFLGVQPYTHIINPDFVVPDEALGSLENALSRLADEEPLQYVLGYSEFYGRRFNVSPAVLIPRPETELLCRLAIEKLAGGTPGKSLRIIDLCTGSGCIAWTMALSLPSATVVGVDISAEALEVAETQPFDCAQPPVFLRRDVLDPTSLDDLGQFDVLLSNPPYVTEAERSLMSRNVTGHEPDIALFVPVEDSLRFYKPIAEFAKKRLLPEGFGIVEINEALGTDTEKVFRLAGFSRTSVEKDLCGKDRFVFFSK